MKIIDWGNQKIDYGGLQESCDLLRNQIASFDLIHIGGCIKSTTCGWPMAARKFSLVGSPRHQQY